MSKNKQENDTVKLNEVIASLWWMPLVKGILLLILGTLILFNPGESLLGILWLFGLYWIVDGIFDFIEATVQKSGAATYFSSIISILAGAFILSNPLLAGLISNTIITFVFGISIIVVGLTNLFSKNEAESKNDWVKKGMGILYIIFGLFLLANPIITVGILTWMIFIWAVITGTVTVWLAFKIKGVKDIK